MQIYHSTYLSCSSSPGAPLTLVHTSWPHFQGTAIEKPKILQAHILAYLIARCLRCQNPLQFPAAKPHVPFPSQSSPTEILSVTHTHSSKYSDAFLSLQTSTWWSSSGTVLSIWWWYCTISFHHKQTLHHVEENSKSLTQKSSLLLSSCTSSYSFPASLTAQLLFCLQLTKWHLDVARTSLLCYFYLAKLRRN